MKKKILIAVITVIIIAISIPIIMIQEALQMQRQEELERAYTTQNTYFGALVASGTLGSEERSRYLPLYPQDLNVDGINIITYWNLALFSQLKGVHLTYEMVLDYLSQEFEDNGRVRIWTNGRHPEIAAYLEWGPWSSGSRTEFGLKRREIFLNYADENAPFPIPYSLGELPTEMIDALIRKVFDPDYELDLTSIQNRYIAEGRAIVSEDGLSIEFIVPES